MRDPGCPHLLDFNRIIKIIKIPSGDARKGYFILEEGMNEKLMIAEIQEETARTAGLPIDVMFSHCRFARWVLARHIAMHLMRKHTKASFQEIAGAFKNTNYTTVVYACKQIPIRIKQEPEVAKLINQVEHNLKINEQGHNQPASETSRG